MKLYEIQLQFANLLEEYNTVESEAERERIAHELDTLTATKDEKLNACCQWLRNLEAERDVVKMEMARLELLHDRAEANAESFRKYIAQCIGVGEKWSNGLFSLSWRKSEAVKVVDDKAIPAQYLREILKYEPDKKAIAADLKCGATIPGVELEVRHSLQVK